MLARTVKVIGRVGASLLLLALMGVATGVRRENRRVQRRVEDSAREFHMEERRPETFETLHLVPAADLAADVLADAAINDSLGEVSLRDMTDSQRRIWLTSLLHIDEELEASRDILLDSVAARPGWAYHWSLLGQVEYALWRRHGMSGPLGKYAWIEPLRLGVLYAEGDIPNWAFLGGAYLESWPMLSSEDRRQALSALRFAARDPDFVRRDLTWARRLVGDGVMSLLPDDPASLSAAIQAFLSANLPTKAGMLVGRWEKSERVARLRDLAALKRRIQLGDFDGARTESRSWLNQHPFDDFADLKSIDQLMELVRLWPSGSQGEWTRDPRRELVLFFLEHPEYQVDGPSLARMVDSMAGVPFVIRAQAALRVDDLAEALRMQHDADAQGSFEWNPFVRDLARFYLQKGKLERARSALAQLSASSAEECDSRLLIQRVEQKASGEESFGVDQESLNTNAVTAVWRKAGAAAVCLGPKTQRSVEMRAASAQPVLVDVGWDGLRAATVLCKSSIWIRFSVPLSAGLHSFFVKPRGAGSLDWTLDVR